MNIRTKIILLLLCLLAGWFQVSAQSKIIPPEKPKLIIGIVVDQMRADYITRFWQKFGSDGFYRLINEGADYTDANQNYIYTQTGPGHATIYTGTTPSVHGIVANYWWARTKNEKVYCVADPKTTTVGSESSNGKMSPRNLLCSTITDELKLLDPQSKIIGISLKDRAAILPAGHTPDACYWYDDDTGDWISSSYYMKELPKWVKEFNKKRLPDFYLERQWVPYLPIDQYTESLPDSNAYEVGMNDSKKITFPYDLLKISAKPGNSKKPEKDYSYLKYTPFGNTLTLDLALAAIVNEQLGKDDHTDFLAISFSSTDYIGHAFGPKSVETEDTYIRLDKEIAHLLNFLADSVGKQNVLIFLTSDHGVADNPQYLTDRNIPSGVFKYNLAMALLRSYLNAVYGQGDWVTTYLSGQIYLNRNLIEDSKLSLEEFQTRAANFLVQFSGVANVLTSSNLQTTSYTSGIFLEMQNSFHQKLSGDLLINLEPGWISECDLAADHNSGYSYDTHVPLLWWGWRINHLNVSRPVFLIDIAPTISSFLKINYPNGCTGEPLKELTE